MNKVFSDKAWEHYMYWQGEDRKTLKRINKLITDIDRHGNEGIGKPEPLTLDYAGMWSRRIDEKNRLVYKVDDGAITIVACRFRYDDK